MRLVPTCLLSLSNVFSPLNDLAGQWLVYLNAHQPFNQWKAWKLNILPHTYDPTGPLVVVPVGL